MESGSPAASFANPCPDWQCGDCARFKLAQWSSFGRTHPAFAAFTLDKEIAMSDIPDQPNPPAPTPYPEITPNPGIEEAPDTPPSPQEDDTGRPHDRAPGT